LANAPEETSPAAGQQAAISRLRCRPLSTREKIGVISCRPAR